jgi:ribose/xylose/arabinose/galactoside ABC-type transport system permease subunit
MVVLNLRFPDGKIGIPQVFIWLFGAVLLYDCVVARSRFGSA